MVKNIAIDGPSGAGKSTVAKIIANKLDILYLDTGAMYRAIGLKVFNLGKNPNDYETVTSILNETKVDVLYENGSQHTYLDGVDVSKEIRMHEISKYASDVSKHKSVRFAMADFQREIAKKQSTVIDGRDIGSFVLPDCKNKFFLTASAETRAKRRFDELVEKGDIVDYENILNDVKQRDFNDMNREIAPLVKTSDAIEINSDGMTANEVAEKIISLLK